MTASEWSLETDKLRQVLDKIEQQLKDLRARLSTSRSHITSEMRWTYDELKHDVGSFDMIIELAEQADLLARESREVEVAERELRRLTNLLTSPYFGRMDFAEEGGHGTEAMYLGTASVFDRSSATPVVFDWRAPVCSMFYEDSLGPASYLAPDGVIGGVLSLKRQFRIEDGELKYMFDSDVHIGDDVLQGMLSQSANDRMRSIVASIQKDQNQIIRDEQHDTVIVLGPAGSGKTSVALQRAAYLLYAHRKSISANHILLWTPNRVFQSYISNVLPELGEDPVLETTFEAYADGVLGRDTAWERPYDHLETVFSQDYDSPAIRLRGQSVSWKTSRQFLEVLSREVERFGKEGLQFTDVKLDRRVVISGDQTHEMFYTTYGHLPIPLRLEKIRDWIEGALEPLETEVYKKVEKKLRTSRKYEGTDQEIEHYSRQFAKRKLQRLRDILPNLPEISVLDIYRALFERPVSDWGALPVADSVNLEAIRSHSLAGLTSGTIPYEDVAPLVYLHTEIFGPHRLSAIRHVFIDEAQDYGPLHFQVFRRLFPRSRFTVLGDPTQSIHPFVTVTSPDDIAVALQPHRTVDDRGAVGVSDRVDGRADGGTSHLTFLLRTSYRSTEPILAFAKALVPNAIPVESVGRSGPKPKLVHIATDGVQWNPDSRSRRDGRLGALIEILTDLDRAGRVTRCLICKTLSEAKALYEQLNLVLPVQLVTPKSKDYRPGPLVMPAYLAKGLEFDAVVVVDAERYNHALDRHLLYTVCTRAMHELVLLNVGTVSPLVASVGGTLYEEVARVATR